MRTHPIRSRFRVLAILTALLLTPITACTGTSPTPQSNPTAAPAPAGDFPSLPNRSSGASEKLGMIAAGDGKFVTIGVQRASTSVPIIRWSTDGLSWQQGTLHAPAEAPASASDELDGVASLTTSGKTTWLAVGHNAEFGLTYTSSDARSWERHGMPALDWRTDLVEGLSASPEAGFVLVGYRRSPGTNSRSPMVWRSPDGINWSTTKLPGSGRLRSVVADGARVVAVGIEGRTTVTKSGIEFPLVYTSTDAGAHFQAVKISEPADGYRFAHFLSAVTKTAAGLVATGGYFAKDLKYHTVLHVSTDGLRWSSASPTAFKSANSTEGKEVLGVPGGTLIGVQEISARTKVAIFTGSGNGWSKAKIPASQLQNNSGVRFAGAGSIVLVNLVGESNGDEVSALWRSVDGGKSFASVDLSAAEAGDVIDPAELVHRGDEITAIGSAQGAQVVWRRGADGRFGEPTVVSNDPLDRIVGAASAPKRVLIWGSKNAFSNDHAETWETTDTLHFRTARIGSFERAAQYHYSEIKGGIWAGDRWVVVGERSSNGDVRRSALVATSTDAEHWTNGQSTRVFRRGDGFSASDPLSDLDGLENAGRWMSGVAVVGRGLVAVGGTESNRRSSAAVWLSADKVRWKLAALPAPSGKESFASRVAATGNSVVALGGVRAAGQWRTYLWTSKDGGRTWRGFDPPNPGDSDQSGAELAFVNGRFVATARPTDGGQVLAWSSADGVDWRTEQVSVPGLTSGDQVTVRSLLADGDGVLVLVKVDGVASGRAVVVRVPIG